jgi:hypothetical protein
VFNDLIPVRGRIHLTSAQHHFHPLGCRAAALRLTPIIAMAFDGEIAGGPTTSPTLYLSSGQTDHRGRLVVSQGWSLMKKQHKPEALDSLDR